MRFLREQRGEIDTAKAGIDDGRGGIDRSQLRLQLFGHLWRGKVQLGHDHVVGGCHLPQCLAVAVEVARAIDGVDSGHHPLDPEMIAHDRLGDDGVQDWRRIGKPGRFDDDAVETGDRATLALAQQVAQCLRQVVAHRAADAAVAQQRRAHIRFPHQMVIDPDLPKLVDDDGDLAGLGIEQEVPQQRRLATAEKPGDDENRDRTMVVRHRHQVLSGSADPLVLARARTRSRNAGASGSSGAPRILLGRG